MQGSLPLAFLLTLMAASCGAPATQAELAQTALDAPTVSEGSTPHIAAAPSTAEASHSHTVDDLAWLSGRWVGTGIGGVCEETWNPPMGAEGERSMVGTFRLYDNENAVNFYEIMTLVKDDDGSVVLRLVHLSKELRPWEEPGETTDFRLIRIEGTTAWYEGLTMHREGDSLVVYVAMTTQAGGVREATLRMRRS